MTIAATDEAVHVRAPGKINLFMRVGELDADGYHDVATAYQAVSLYEDLRAWPSDEFTVAFTGSVDTTGLPADRTNLAIRAARLLARTAGVPGGVHLEIDKHVPIAGGMGGGSADAAAALVACDALWGTALSKDDLHAMAAELGADVPFALTGGTAIGTGRGDRLSPALATGSFHWVLVVADHGLSTPAVYAELDRIREEQLGTGRRGPAAAPAGSPVVDPEVLHALRAGDPELLARAVRNDLQHAALRLAPDLAELLDLGVSLGALSGLVSGSGPTVAFLTESAESAIELQVALSAARRTALHVHGPVGGTRIVHG
ncbi:4-(cytidine 5'-diphospho)-2-C-methyl-D-erythritol kinase [Agromyces intestinalis]|uniref:4-diphosphocytidyl-2-C-methyl-D-erythritol kinase n=1 Tax=Agromyces intestinalis TaxID=2592652 RepID=A0A5C1YHG0_9MICO|nr:4-(cytidine 5'-diphospho)-2-C-methyl-D-erythritol kinase [Agromyces intestinalis]QEO15393.1 4-(cytidine 5'-diphospho)-2-C-methyl-D-erythritol kinase [Agromyces intestinalis]